MGTEARQKVITDASVLINFLVVRRLDLLANHPTYRFVITDHVRAEVTEHYTEQVNELASSIEQGNIEETSVTTPQELQAFAELIATGRLGAGECSAIAAATCGGLPLAIDDVVASKHARRLAPRMQILTTPSLVVALIKAGTLEIDAADLIKAQWETHHAFKLKVTSFRDLL